MKTSKFIIGIFIFAISLFSCNEEILEEEINQNSKVNLTELKIH